MTYIQLNPMLHLAELFRSPIYLGVIPDWNIIVIAWAWATASLLFGWWNYLQERRIVLPTSFNSDQHKAQQPVILWKMFHSLPHPSGKNSLP